MQSEFPDAVREIVVDNHDVAERKRASGEKDVDKVTIAELAVRL
jgi:hypothetical protein